MMIEFPTRAVFLNRCMKASAVETGQRQRSLRLWKVGNAVGCTLHKDRAPMGNHGNQGGTADYDFVPFLEGMKFFLWEFGIAVS